MKKFVIQAILLLVLIGGGIYFYRAETVPEIPFVPESPKSEQLLVGNTKINATVANTEAERSKGLGGTENLASDSGMLFTFDKQDKYAFWMKGMKFALDFIWIKDDEVVEVTENVPNPPEGTKDADLTIYQAKEAVNKVLEVNAGFVREHGIKVGDKIEIVQ